MANKTIITGFMGIDPFAEHKLFHTQEGRDSIREAGMVAVRLAEAWRDERKALDHAASRLAEDYGLTQDQAIGILKSQRREKAEAKGEFGWLGIFLIPFILPVAIYELFFGD